MSGARLIGEAPGAPGFCWLAGLSGYGIQSAPATGQIAAALLTGRAPHLPGAARIDLAALSPRRLL